MTLVECLTAIAVTATILTVVLRLVFLTDRSLAAVEQRAQTTGAAARLWDDLSRDLRGASAVTGSSRSGADGAAPRIVWAKA